MTMKKVMWNYAPARHEALYAQNQLLYAFVFALIS